MNKLFSFSILVVFVRVALSFLVTMTTRLSGFKHRNDSRIAWGVDRHDDLIGLELLLVFHDVFSLSMQEL